MKTHADSGSNLNSGSRLSFAPIQISSALDAVLMTEFLTLSIKPLRRLHIFLPSPRALVLIFSNCLVFYVYSVFSCIVIISESPLFPQLSQFSSLFVSCFDIVSGSSLSKPVSLLRIATTARNKSCAEFTHSQKINYATEPFQTGLDLHGVLE